MDAKAKPFHIASLDGLRAVAVLIVFAFHIAPRLGIGGFGVTVFFFLSGFLITTLMRVELERTGALSLRHFYLRRVMRIFPPMYLALLVATIASVVMHVHVEPRTIGLQAVHLTNYQMGVAGGAGQPVGSSVLWSLAVEEHFYLLFPLGFLMLRKVVARPERQGAVLLGVCALVLAWRLVLVLGLDVRPAYVSYATETRIDSILYGCVLALWHNPAYAPAGSTIRRWPAGRLWIAVGLGVAAIATTMLMRRVELRTTLAYSIHGLALAPIFVAAIQLSTQLPWRWLDWGPVRWIGLVSYSLYLLHLPIIELVRRYVTTSTPLLAAIALPLAIAVSSLVYVAIEKPFARLRKRLSKVEGR